MYTCDLPAKPCWDVNFHVSIKNNLGLEYWHLCPKFGRACNYQPPQHKQPHSAISFEVLPFSCLSYVAFNNQLADANQKKNSLVCLGHCQYLKHFSQKNRPLQPQKLTWNLKISTLKRKIIFQTFISGFHVTFSGAYPSPDKPFHPSPNPPKTIGFWSGLIRQIQPRTMVNSLVVWGGGLVYLDLLDM